MKKVAKVIGVPLVLSISFSFLSHTCALQVLYCMLYKYFIIILFKIVLSVMHTVQPM